MLEYGISRKFAKISENKLKIIDIILDNDKIIQYSINLGKVDIENIKVGKKERKDFFKQNLLLNYFTHDLKNTDMVYYTINPVEGLNRARSPLSQDIYEISILCPVAYWFISERMVERPFVIAEEIAKSLDQQRVFGTGQLNIGRWYATKLNDDFACLTLQLEVSNASVKI